MSGNNNDKLHKMIRNYLKMLMLLLVVAFTMSAPVAHAGLVSDVLKRLGKAGASLVDDVLKEAAEDSPTIARMLKQYGDEAIVTLSRNPERIKLVESLGDDAAEALLKHGDIAENLLRISSSTEVATALKGVSRESGQYLSMCVAKKPLDVNDCKNLVFIVREGGEESAKKLSRLSPSRLDKVLKTAQTAGVAAAVGMVVTTAAVSDDLGDFLDKICSLFEWIWNHPILALLIFALTISLIIKFPGIALAVVLWLPRACWAALVVLWRMVRKKDNKSPN